MMQMWGPFCSVWFETDIFEVQISHSGYIFASEVIGKTFARNETHVAVNCKSPNRTRQVAGQRAKTGLAGNAIQFYLQ